MAEYGMGSQVRLKVTPEQLRNKASEVTRDIQAMQNAFDELAGVVERTGHYWMGDAGNLHRRFYKEDMKDIDIMLRRWREHPSDLLKMAHVYDETEQKVEKISSELPNDVIV